MVCMCSGGVGLNGCSLASSLRMHAALWTGACTNTFSSTEWLRAWVDNEDADYPQALSVGLYSGRAVSVYIVVPHMCVRGEKRKWCLPWLPLCLCSGRGQACTAGGELVVVVHVGVYVW